MVIIKLTRNGKCLLVVEEDGNVYICAASIVERLLASKDKQKVIVLSLLPDQVAPGRFPSSVLYDPEGRVGTQGSNLSTSNDSLSTKAAKNREQSKVYNMDVDID